MEARKRADERKKRSNYVIVIGRSLQPANELHTHTHRTVARLLTKGISPT